MSSAAIETPAQAVAIMTPELGDQTHRHSTYGKHLQGVTYDKSTRILRCSVKLEDGSTVWAYRVVNTTLPDTIYVQPQNQARNAYYSSYWYITENHFTIEDVEPFITVEATGPAHTRKVRIQRNYGYGHGPSGIDSYSLGNVGNPGSSHIRHSHGGNWPEEPYLFLPVRIAHPESGSSVEATLRFMRPTGGRFSVLNDKHADPRVVIVTKDFYGVSVKWQFSVYSWTDLHHLLSGVYECDDSREDLWNWGLDSLKVPTDPSKADQASVKALWKKKVIKPQLDRLATEEPLLHRFFLFLHSGKNQDKVSNNQLIKAFLEAHGEDYDAIVKGLRDVMVKAHTVAPYKAESKSYSSADIETRNMALLLPGGAEANAEVRAKKEWQYQQGNNAKAVALGVDEKKHPLLLAAIGRGDIPIGLFHEPAGPDHLVNTEFDLWEKCLGTKGWAEVIFQIAATASRRSTYTKRLTSYLMFLWTLPAYLDKHAPRMTPSGKKSKQGWRAMPVFVDSSDKLELEEPNEEGTVKTRSALTPVADNDMGVITIPYAALQMHGYGTTYMYSDRYYVVEAGMNDPIGPGMFETDLAEKLNGRDDYGLCWYTLTGTDQNTGYPTFLIIYERLSVGKVTRVHFHRVRPCRTFNGAPTPSNQLIERCYKYMAGNVAADEIYKQQGDILLLKAPNGAGNKVDEGKIVAGFEDHRFEPLMVDGKAEPVTLYRSTAKTRGNLLGWVNAPTGFRMPHPEHEDVEDIPPGWYSVRRCRSWEANPQAVWSFTAD